MGISFPKTAYGEGRTITRRQLNSSQGGDAGSCRRVIKTWESGGVSPTQPWQLPDGTERFDEFPQPLDIYDVKLTIVCHVEQQCQ